MAAMNRQYYLRLREVYRPASIKVIFILESPPCSGKYFYDPNGKTGEPLFSAMMKLLNAKPHTKAEGLKLFQEAGYILVDATYRPVNHLIKSQKKEIILDDYRPLVDDLCDLTTLNNPKIILATANIFHLLEKKLLDDKFDVINNGEVIKYPGRWQKEFKEKVAFLISSNCAETDFPVE
jgi:hypothetical protein